MVVDGVQRVAHFHGLADALQGLDVLGPDRIVHDVAG